MTQGTSAAGRGALQIISFYQRYISVLTGPTCRYHPTCSHYATTAIQRHGFFRGTRLAAWRLLRCVPWTPGGIDDVPPTVTRHPEPPALHDGELCQTTSPSVRTSPHSTCQAQE